ncbi:alpha/beta hydrolase [Dactylosporangium sp. CS-033363]|uniref:alpha/beta hydrolase n=1 Tax=Dactylosporangium sp. CS-033363 TaxID=3239935 RepID=UPI003D910372
MELTVQGLTITANTAGPDASARPLIAALHGGTYTGRYFAVPGSAHGSFMDTAAAAGYRVVSFDRPGYGGSTALAPAENTFDRHADLLAEAIALTAERAGADRVFLVGHSIGGMIATMVAASQPRFGLIGMSVTGMGAELNSNGAAHALAALPPDGTIDLPYEERDKVMFGPEGTFTAEAVKAAHDSYAPVPVRELIQAPAWPAERLAGLAPLVRVPVHNALAEHDMLWDSAPEHVARFAGMLSNAPFVEAAVARGTGHSIDHHTLGHALHLRQLAFAEECAAWAERR